MKKIVNNVEPWVFFISIISLVLSIFAVLISYYSYNNTLPHITLVKKNGTLLVPDNKDSELPDFIITDFIVRNTGSSGIALEEISLTAITPNGELKSLNAENILFSTKEYQLPIQVEGNSSQKLSIRWIPSLEGIGKQYHHKWRVIPSPIDFSLEIRDSLGNAYILKYNKNDMTEITFGELENATDFQIKMNAQKPIK